MRVKLGDIFEIGSGGTPSKSHPEYYGGSIPWVKTGDLKSKYLYEVEDYITEKGLKHSSTKLYETDTVLMAMYGATIGATSILKMAACTNQACAAFKKNEIVIPEYLYYFLRSQKEKFAKDGVGGAQPNISANYLKKVEMELPFLESQRRIVNIIDRVANIVSERKKEIQSLDNLIKARFVEMFGKLKDAIRLGDCCEVHARIGWQALTRDEHMQSGDYLLVTGTDFVAGKVNYDTCAYVSKERYEMDPHIILRDNDVLITKDGSIGKVAVVHDLPKPATLNSGVFVVRPDDKFNKEYISYVFRGPLFERFVELSKTGATIKHLNQKHLVDFCIPLPSMEEQKTFAIFSKQIDKSKVVVQKALDETQVLFDSLMQKYFG